MLPNDAEKRTAILGNHPGFTMSGLIRRFVKNQRGANIIEYVILAGFIAVASVLASTDGANTLRALLTQ